MKINFDKLPNSNPGSGGTVPKGTYYGTIKSAEIRQPQNSSKPEYLNIRIALKNKEGRDVGIVYDKIFGYPTEYMRYKLGRFLKALELNLQGEVEFKDLIKDLVKILPEKQVILDITTNKEGYNEVDLFTGDIYYSMADASSVFGETAPAGEYNINADDAVDATPDTSQY